MLSHTPDTAVGAGHATPSTPICSSHCSLCYTGACGGQPAWGGAMVTAVLPAHLVWEPSARALGTVLTSEGGSARPRAAHRPAVWRPSHQRALAVGIKEKGELCGSTDWRKGCRLRPNFGCFLTFAPHNKPEPPSREGNYLLKCVHGGFSFSSRGCLPRGSSCHTHCTDETVSP